MPSAAVQFNGAPPVLVIVTGRESGPVETLNVNVPGAAVSEGGAKTVKVTPTACGLPVIARPLLTPASEIEPVYDPAARADDATVTVKVALLPLATVAEAGDTASQPVPLAIGAVGVTVSLPVQAPVPPTGKVCVAGFMPTELEKVSLVTEGSCSVHTGCTVRVTAITSGFPTANFVTLSMAVRVTVPV